MMEMVKALRVEFSVASIEEGIFFDELHGMNVELLFMRDIIIGQLVDDFIKERKATYWRRTL